MATLLYNALTGPGNNSKLNYVISDYLGKGRFTTVFQVREVSTNTLHAVSCFSLISGCNVLNLATELNRIIALEHTNLVKYNDLKLSSALCFIRSEYQDWSVRKQIQTFGKLEESLVKTYVRSIMKGIKYLHLKKMAHGSLNCSNIKIDACGNLRLLKPGNFIHLL